MSESAEELKAQPLDSSPASFPLPDSQSYTNILPANKYVFFAAYSDSTIINPPAPAGTPIDWNSWVTRILNQTTGITFNSLPDALPIHSYSGGLQTQFLMGWYNTNTKTYGSAFVRVERDEGSDNGLGSHGYFNDGQEHDAPGWVTVHWNDSGQDIYAHYADSGDFHVNASIDFSIQLSDPGTPSDRCEVGVSHYNGNP